MFLSFYLLVCLYSTLLYSLFDSLLSPLSLTHTLSFSISLSLIHSLSVALASARYLNSRIVLCAVSASGWDTAGRARGVSADPGPAVPAPAGRRHPGEGASAPSINPTSLTHPLNHSIHHYLNHSLTHLLAHSHAHSITQSLNYSLTYSLTHSITHSLIHSLIHSLNHSLTHSPAGRTG